MKISYAISIGFTSLVLIAIQIFMFFVFISILDMGYFDIIWDEILFFKIIYLHLVGFLHITKKR